MKERLLLCLFFTMFVLTEMHAYSDVSLADKSSKAKTSKLRIYKDKSNQKICKDVIYEGEVTKKTPCGNGRLIFIVNQRHVAISGLFNGCEVNNAQICWKTGWGGSLYFKKIIYEINQSKGSASLLLKGIEKKNFSSGPIGLFGKYTDYTEIKENEYKIELVADERDGWHIISHPSEITSMGVLRFTKNNGTFTFKYNIFNKNHFWSAPDEIKLEPLHFDNGVNVSFKQKFDDDYIAKGVSGIIRKDFRTYYYEIQTKDSTKLKWEHLDIGDSTSYYIDQYDIMAFRIEGSIEFPNGAVYKGTAILCIHGLRDCGVFGENLLGNEIDNFEIIFNNGDFIKPDGRVVYWKNGESDEDLYDYTFNAYPCKYDYRWDEYIELRHRAYDNSTLCNSIKFLRYLIRGDAATYFGIENVKTDLQKKAFQESEEYKTIYLPRLQVEQQFLWEDEYLVHVPINNEDNTYYKITDFHYDLISGRFQFEIGEKENEKINKDFSDFHLRIIKTNNTDLCVTYPKSLISATIGNQMFTHDRMYKYIVQTGKVSENDALKVENNMSKCEMVWVFKLEKIDDERGRLYGKTTHVYIVNKDTKEIYCDLSKSLGASQIKFKSKKVFEDTTPKKVYHSRGRVENCGVCLGTGLGMGTGSCFLCGGKGWYVEHNW